MELTRAELSQGKITETVNEIIIRNSEPILIEYANWYKRDPKGFIKFYLNSSGMKMIAVLINFSCLKNGLLKELEGQKDFSEWVNKQSLEERWKPVLNKFLLILWGVTNNQ